MIYQLYYDITQKVKEYLEKIKDVPKEKIVYIDETGIDNCLSRQYGRSPKGERVYGKVYGHKFKRTNIVAAQQNNQILAPLEPVQYLRSSTRINANVII